MSGRYAKCICQQCGHPTKRTTEKTVYGDFHSFLCSNAACPVRRLQVCDMTCNCRRTRAIHSVKVMRRHMAEKHNRATPSVRSVVGHPGPHSTYDHNHIEDSGDNSVSSSPVCKRPNSVPTTGPTGPNVLDFASDNLTRYQRICIKHSPVQAAKELVLQSSTQKRQCLENCNTIIDAASVRHFLRIASLVTDIGENHRDLLAKVLSCYSPPKYGRIVLPSTVTEFSSQILNLTNKNSLLSLLPVPSFKRSVKSAELTTCSIRQIAAFAMMFPAEPNFRTLHPRFFSIVDSLNFNKQLKRLLDRTPSCIRVIAYAIMWSDGWDPNTKSKGNRASVWTGTAGFLLVDVSGRPFPYDIVPGVWSVGGGKDGHNVAFEELYDELKAHNQNADGILIPFKTWSRFHKTVVEVYVCLGPFLQDQLERRAAAQLLGGNSNMHALFGTSCSFDDLAKPFKACQMCISRLDKYILTANWEKPCSLTCKNCHAWDMRRLQSEGRYKKRLVELKHFDEGDFGYGHMVGPKEITFLDTTAAFEFAFRRYVAEGQWTRKDVKVYLELFCIAPATTAAFLFQSQEHMAGIEATRVGSVAFSSEQERLSVLRDKERNPHLYISPEPPAIWKLTTLRNLPESVMHLAMNLQKTIMRLVIDFATSKKLGTTLVDRCKTVLQMVQNLRVSGVQVRTFNNEKFGGFVAENYRAVFMILPWWSNILLEEGYDKVVQPVDYTAMQAKSVNEWTVDCMKHWLDQRGIEYGKRWLKADVKAEVETYIGDTSLEIVEQPTGSNCTANMVRDLVQKCHKLFSLLFGTDEVKEAGHNRYSAVARRFMSALDNVHSSLYPNQKIPVWRTKYNTMGVLRAAEMFADHNLPRNMHEGGELGEAIVKTLRAQCPQAVRDGWSANLVNKFYRKRGMQGISGDVEIRDEMFGLGPQVLSKFKRYKSENIAKAIIDEGGALSGLSYWDSTEGRNRVGIVVNDKRWYFLEICLEHGSTYADPSGFTYFKVLGFNKGLPYPANLKSLDVSVSIRFRKHVIFLPYLWSNGTMDTYYYAPVSEDWDHLNENGWVNA